MELRTRQHVTDPRLKLSQQELERCLLELEQTVYPELHEGGSKNGVSLANRVQKLCDNARFRVQTLQDLIPSERDPTKRELNRKKLEQSISRLRELESKGRDRERSWQLQARQDREDLLGGANGFDPEQADQIALAVAENDSLKSSNRMTDDILQLGGSVLEAMSNQREIIKRTTEKMESVAGSLGISNSVLRAVKRRQWGDAMIVYGGMVGIVLILFLFYRWLHR